MKSKDMVGKKFGRWLVIDIKKPSRPVMLLCKCECGNEKYVSAYQVHSGRSKSCCGVSGGRMKHGMSNTNIYIAWCAMRNRCEKEAHPAYKDYGARGIKVCDRWQKFENFYSDMGDRPKGKSLERVDNNKGYSPDNCIWATSKQQARNKRGLRMVTANGHTKSLGEWSDITGLSVGTLWNRLALGWTDEEAINTPKVMKKRSSYKRERLLDRSN